MLNKKFKTLFGIEPSEIKKTCILMPFPSTDIIKEIDVAGWSKGMLYACGQTPYATIIKTGIGTALNGDAVLYLNDTNCEHIILFGSCGCIKKTKFLDVGSIVSPKVCFGFENFTDLIRNNFNVNKLSPSKELQNKIRFFNDIHEVTCATISSLYLEEQDSFLNHLEQIQIEVVDMECSAVFSAAEHLKKRVCAIFYVTDIVKEKPFYLPLSLEDKIVLKESKLKALKIVNELIQNFT